MLTSNMVDMISIRIIICLAASYMIIRLLLLSELVLFMAKT